MDGACEMEDFLSSAYRLSRSGETDKAIDLIFGSFDDLMSAGNFGACDEILGRVELEKLEPTLMVSFLTITLAAKTELPARARLWNLVRARLIELFGEQRTGRILVGLE